MERSHIRIEQAAASGTSEKAGVTTAPGVYQGKPSQVNQIEAAD